MKDFCKKYYLHIISTLIGISVFLITLCFWTDYFYAEHKFSVEATLINVNMTTEKILKKKDSPDYTVSNKYRTEYNYELTWMFENPESHKTYTFIYETSSSTVRDYHGGQKQTLFIYYNDDEADYETASPAETIIILAVGLIFIAIPLWDVTDKAVRRRKQQKNLPENKSHRSYVPGYLPDYLKDEKPDKISKE